MMKKIISIFMVLVLAFACFSITAFADTNSKIDSSLLEVLEEVEDDYKVQIFVWLYDTVDEELVVQMTYEECGLTKETAVTKEEVDLYLHTYRNIMSDMYEAHNKVVFEKMNIADEDVIFFSIMTPSFILRATKTKVYELAQLEEVASIGVYKYPILPQPDHIFEARFLEIYADTIFSETHDYDELYYHYDENGDIDWALIEQCSYNSPPWNYHALFKGRIFMYGSHTPFSFRYGLYDVNEDKFYDIINDDFDFSKYEGLEEVFESFNLGYPVGDADRDGILSVMDATAIQQYLAGLVHLGDDDEVLGYYGYKSYEELGYPKYVSDFDCDGERSILDATGIQLKLAGLSE